MENIRIVKLWENQRLQTNRESIIWELANFQDDELVAAVKAKENEKLEYLGAIIYGNTEEVNEITGKFQLWRMD